MVWLMLLSPTTSCEFCGCQERPRVEKTPAGTLITEAPAQEGRLQIRVEAPATSNLSICAC
jgi:hypothetical protein